jgi:hypothetical protein
MTRYAKRKLKYSANENLVTLILLDNFLFSNNILKDSKKFWLNKLIKKINKNSSVMVSVLPHVKYFDYVLLFFFHNLFIDDIFLSFYQFASRTYPWQVL